MSNSENNVITVKTTIEAPLEKVWKLWTDPRHIIRWNHASDDWHTTKAKNDLRVGGRFQSRMEAKDGSRGFDFTGEYKRISENKEIVYVIADGRMVDIRFGSIGNKTTIIESFEAEGIHSAEMQRSGWQSILDNFKRYTEAQVTENEEG